MNKTKTENIGNEDEGITINLKKSSLAEFTERPLPSDTEVENFEKIIEEKDSELNPVFDEELGEEIEESLNEIYQDDNGDMVDVKKMDVKKKRGFFYWLFMLILVFAALGASAFYYYENYYLQKSANASAVDFSVSGKSDVIAGEEYFYTITYKNTGKIGISDTQIRVNYPENFKILDIYPESVKDNPALWQFDYIPANATNEIKIKGMMIGPKGKTGIIQATMTYVPENFSSEFKKESTFATNIIDVGLEFEFDYVSSVLIGENDEITLRFNARENSYIGNFRITLEPQENLEILAHDGKDLENLATYTMERPGVWEITEAGKDEKIMPIRFKFNKKEKDREELVFKFAYKNQDGQYSEFYQETLGFDVMKSDLNLTLIINGAREDGNVNFGDTLHYSLVYKNKGETEMKDVVIMAVLESDFLNWTTLQYEKDGKEKGNTITWTKEEIPDLAAIAKNEEGIIDFSISLMGAGTPNEKREYQVKSYAQFSIGNIEDEGESAENNLSNTIISRINSDLTLNETLRYFSRDNIPVGTGPHPPRVGETTTYKVYWEISNNLNELNELAVKLVLPPYVNYDNKNRATVGDIRYDENTREVSWLIGRLPVTVFQASAEFSISVTPAEEDRNKIMVLLPGSKVSAIDSKTEAALSQTTKAKTTKLEDDDIAKGDGIVN